jgi:hypothetical protein
MKNEDNNYQGQIEYVYGIYSRGMSITKKDASGNQMQKNQYWYDSSGAVAQEDVFNGESQDPSYSNYYMYDNWGNMIYSRDATGHERFSSYANTYFQYGFFGPGRLEQSHDGKILYDNFDDRDVLGWTLNIEGGTISPDSLNFEPIPPSLKIDTTSQEYVASAEHEFEAQDTYLIVEFMVMAAETNKPHHVFLNGIAGPRIDFIMDEFGMMKHWHETEYIDFGMYQALRWYKIMFVVSVSSNTFDVWVNGMPAGYGVNLLGSGAIDTIEFQPGECDPLGCGNSDGVKGTMWVDEVNIYQGDSVSIEGLKEKQIVELYDTLDGKRLFRKMVQADQTDIDIEIFISPMSSPEDYFSPACPYCYLIIFDVDRTPQHKTPFQFWGGSSYLYTPPHMSTNLMKVTTGFLKDDDTIEPSPFVDDSVPPGSTLGTEGGDHWNWVESPFPVSGTLSHESKYLVGTHSHYFTTDQNHNFKVENCQFHIQYIYLPENVFTSEIMLQFFDDGSWEHRAYWGENLIEAGVDGTPSRLPMGDIPYIQNRWLMFIVEHGDVFDPEAPCSEIDVLEGFSYRLVGSKAFWDYTAVGDSRTGSITIQNLIPGDEVEFFDDWDDPEPEKSRTVPDGSDEAEIDLYVEKINVFPISGYFRITRGSEVYTSPLYTNIWGGDEYWFTPSEFPHTDMQYYFWSKIHNKLIGQKEWQNGKEVLNFSFDIDNSNNVIDTSGYGNQVENQGTEVGSGILGEGRKFVLGEDDGIKVTDNTLLDTNEEFTISIMRRVLSFQSGEEVLHPANIH